MRLRVLTVAVLSLALGACALDQAGTNNAALSGSQPGATGVQNLSTFLGKLEAARGQALPVADRLAVGGIAAETKQLVDTTQNQFVDKVGAVTGLGGDTLRVIVPSAAQPVSDSKLLSGLEQKLGKKLPPADTRAITAANALRNSSLTSLKDNLAQKVGDKTGVGKDTVTALLPLIGL
jgi:hypothetical protein